MSIRHFTPEFNQHSPGVVTGYREAGKPTWQSAGVSLYLGDCRDVWPTLSPVDAVIADIPYGEVNRESGGLRNLDKAEADVVTFSLEEVLSHSIRLGESAYIFCGTEQVSTLRAGFVAAGMTTRLCVWEKTNPSPMNGERFWLSSIECCVFARKSNAYFGEHCSSAVWRGPIERDQVHPTQKPEWLMRRLVKASVPEGGTCLDFCFGSGTTAVACVRTGRKFVGCEVDPKHFATAVGRLEREHGRAPLFEPKPQVQRELLA